MGQATRGRKNSFQLDNRFLAAKPAMRLKKFFSLAILRGPTSLNAQRFQATTV
jgi:hypothetical protein